VVRGHRRGGDLVGVEAALFPRRPHGDQIDLHTGLWVERHGLLGYLDGVHVHGIQLGDGKRLCQAGAAGAAAEVRDTKSHRAADRDRPGREAALAQRLDGRANAS
jgi:hypothetical protein